jgi:eukaryotic-like serine/threonine-protein kinase
LGPAAATPPRSVWDGSASAAVTDVLVPLLTLGVLLGVLLWALAAAVLPWLVRGRSLGRDALAATVWAAALAAAEPLVAVAAGAHRAVPEPRGIVFGALLGATFAVVARAFRGRD